MRIETINDTALVIYLDSGDIERMHVSPHDLTQSEAEEILRNTLGDMRWNDAYLEVFPGRDSMLFFVRARSGNPQFFRFDNIELLISAAKSCPEGVISFLTYNDKAYMLTVHTWNGEEAPAALYEFGEPMEYHPDYSLHLLEHSCILAGPTALDTLRNTF